MPPAPRLRAGLVALLALLSLWGCGSQPPPSPPTGVDGLVIPTPSPDPADFVRGVDHRYFPLAPGRRWTYAVTGGSGESQRLVTVAAELRTVAGVATTVVRTTSSGADRGDRATEDSYAQDRAGNVWWFGHRGPGGWQAGRDGAEAGLVMPAAPRLGDGFRTAVVKGRPVSVDTVVGLDVIGVTPAGEVRDALRLSRADPVTGTTTDLVYAPGLGLVQTVEITGGNELSSLTAVTPPP